MNALLAFLEQLLSPWGKKIQGANCSSGTLMAERAAQQMYNAGDYSREGANRRLALPDLRHTVYRNEIRGAELKRTFDTRENTLSPGGSA
jgi:hypothetical protein